MPSRLTRKTHAFAKAAPTWNALLGLHLFEPNWLRPHRALRVPVLAPTRAFTPRPPAMAIGRTDHHRTWREVLTTPTHICR
jgi:hypothetical protein